MNTIRSAFEIKPFWRYSLKENLVHMVVAFALTVGLLFLLDALEKHFDKQLQRDFEQLADELNSFDPDGSEFLFKDLEEIEPADKGAVAALKEAMSDDPVLRDLVAGLTSLPRDE